MILRFLDMVITCLLYVGILLTAIWPFVAVYVLINGPEDLKYHIPMQASCWLLNVIMIFFLILARRGKSNV